jgi:flagellar basal-body rod protein FlgB
MNFERLLKGMNPAQNPAGRLFVDQPGQIAIGPLGARRFTQVQSPDAEATPTGNSVSLEQEMIKVADTQAQYRAAANLYSKAVALMRTAIGKPGE